MTVVVLALVGMGSVMGTDDVFPFGPFRMYATATSPTGRVGTVVVRGVDAAGRERRIPLGELGLRGAEIEGQLPRFVADPDLLGGLARVYNDRRPDGPPVVALRIERDYVLIDDARVTGRTRRVVARWPR